MQVRQTKWNCESVKVHKKEVTELEFNEMLGSVWTILQSLNCQSQVLFHPKNFMNDPSLQDPKHYRRSA